MSSTVDWTPAVLPCAPRPINGELLSSWVRRLAAANSITLPEICGCIADLSGPEKSGDLFDYGAPKQWRFAMAALTRIPERWVWVLDLQQHFPGTHREWFHYDPARPEQILTSFCPECLAEQLASQQTLHLKAEWAVALVTRCLKHHLPLYRYCPWCGRDQPVQFRKFEVDCQYCGHDLTLRRSTRTSVSPEPFIAAFERAVVEALAGKVPDPAWGDFTARSFRSLLIDLIWMLTTPELIDPSYSYALVDRMVSDGFLPKSPYGYDFKTPFYARSWTEREAVVSAMIQVLLGSQADCAIGVGGYFRRTAEFRPFLEILRSVQRNESQLWARIGRWPRDIQDRAGAALRFLQSKRIPTSWHRRKQGAVRL